VPRFAKMSVHRAPGRTWDAPLYIEGHNEVRKCPVRFTFQNDSLQGQLLLAQDELRRQKYGGTAAGPRDELIT
jgi:hypothetical protein